MAFVDLIGLAELQAKGKAVVRHNGRQILLVTSDKGLFACANRCPHEGYPLSEGVLTEGCVLTCNWHNWKFDLASGETLVGGDALRRFPVRAQDGRVLVELTPEDPGVRRQRVLAGLRQALQDEDQDRLVRETARLMLLGDDPAEAVCLAMSWAAERMEFGSQHAVGSAPDWLDLHDSADVDADAKLAAIGEILGHVADDARGGELFPFAPDQAPWSEAAYLDAVEREDEAVAARLVRGGLASGMDADTFLPALVRAALAHYGSFGHSLIYAVKTVELINRLGPTAAEPLLLSPTRGLVFATREDLLPEFRDYAERLAGWGAPGAAPPLETAQIVGRSAKQAMAIVGAWSGSHPPEAIFAVLTEASAWMLLHADERVFLRTDGKLSDNVNWLDFTHALTFADAGRDAVAAAPELWPALLLQIACFVGRNGAYVDRTLDTAPYQVVGPGRFMAWARERVLDHGLDRFIISAHLLKTLMAGATLAGAVRPAAPTIWAGLNRFLNARIERRHVLRTARQMRAFVLEE